MKTRQVVGMQALITLVCAGISFAQTPARDEWRPGEPAVARPLAPIAPRVPSPPQGLVLFDNGPFVTHPGGGFGGADASALQTALGMTVFGFTASDAGLFRAADDFTVPTGANWRVEAVRVYCYQTSSTTTSTFDFASLRIWNGPPSPPGAGTVIFGDTTTNRLATSAWTNAYRVTDTTLTNNQRPLMAIDITVGTTLTAGTYWIDYNTGGTLASGPFCSPVTILGLQHL